MKEIEVLIQGGIGNQFFGYAFACSMAKEKKCGVKLDLYDYERGYFRKFQLSRLNTHYKKRKNIWIPKVTNHYRRKYLYSDTECYREEKEFIYDDKVFSTDKKRFYPGFSD